MIKKIFIPPVLVLINAFLIILLYFILPVLNLIPFPYNLGGIVISFFGFAIMGKANDLFKKHNTTLYIEKSNKLVTEGVFSKTRNPMYIGMFLLLLGISICSRNIISLLTPFFFLLIIRLYFIPKEEKMMLETFGSDYLDYTKRVRRWI